ncbi:NAD(P)/FAD-dependent oxidoreductase [Nocardia sp. CDC160]|uniref:NAD(P)/FAD-dependent oxidoreductase n=1 Tax=Nocardia sp. CDC160 TaxID=3112166 RepID=UPI002DBD3FE6|nr:FAD-dependent monooxygenase [Nocardia sp. CDC160]MEC3918549.1 FAD-dependent monooxygenase [Nocardia sp. CDC160]
MSPADRHALVLGAGIAGLLAARVLADNGFRVIILERDDAGGREGVGRGGVPQGRHLHGLLDRGRALIEELYPGWTGELVRRGATTAEVLVDTRWYVGGSRLIPTSTGLTSVIATRTLMESVLRERTAADPNIEVRERIAVQGLIGDARSVSGVGAIGVAGPEILAADLVIDATGRGSRIMEWLSAIGAEPPAEERLDVDLGYASRMYRYRPGQLDGHASVIISTGTNGRGGGAVRVEGDRWLVTLAGMLGDHPPVESEDFHRYAANLSAPDIHEIITGTEPLDDPVRYRFRASVRRRFDRQTALPAGLIVLGDAQCAFNPLYAQGMTVAALEAAALRDTLRSNPAPAELPARFYATAADSVSLAWSLAASSDLSHPGVHGPRTLRIRLTNAYVARAHRAAHHDPRVARTFMRVAHLVEPPAALGHPVTAGRIMLRGNGAATTLSDHH